MIENNTTVPYATVELELTIEESTLLQLLYWLANDSILQDVRKVAESFMRMQHYSPNVAMSLHSKLEVLNKVTSDKVKNK